MAYAHKLSGLQLDPGRQHCCEKCSTFHAIRQIRQVFVSVLLGPEIPHSEFWMEMSDQRVESPVSLSLLISNVKRPKWME